MAIIPAIRPIMPSKWSSLLTLDERAFVPRGYPCLRRRHLRKLATDGVQFGSLMDYRGGDLLAYCAWYWQSRQTLQLVRIATDPDHQNKGYASMLIQDMLVNRPKAIQEIFCKVRESDLESQLFFQGLGFVCTETLPGEFPVVGGEDGEEAEDGFYFSLGGKP